MQKISIKFFEDREVRAFWDDENNKWLFSVLGIISVLTDQDDYNKTRNYWKYLKSKLKKEESQLVSITTQLKIIAPDWKNRLTDMLDYNGIILLWKTFPWIKANRFIDWFTFSDESIDWKSKIKAYALFESSFINSIEVGTIKGLQQIHAYLFWWLYDFSWQIRQKNISKGGFRFAAVQYLENSFNVIEQMPKDDFNDIVDKYIEMNIAHPFMEWNGRSTRVWLDMILKKYLKKCVDWSKISKNDYMSAMIESPSDSNKITNLLENALTNEINSREMFMKGIDYSYYYEEN